MNYVSINEIQVSLFKTMGIDSKDFDFEDVELTYLTWWMFEHWLGCCSKKNFLDWLGLLQCLDLLLQIFGTRDEDSI